MAQLLRCGPRLMDRTSLTSTGRQLDIEKLQGAARGSDALVVPLSHRVVSLPQTKVSDWAHRSKTPSEGSMAGLMIAPDDEEILARGSTPPQWIVADQTVTDIQTIYDGIPQRELLALLGRTCAQIKEPRKKKTGME
jgi:hypothetical protein